MAKVLINDGIHPTGLKLLAKAGISVQTDHIPQDELMSRLPEFDGICVRSATKVRESLISNCPNLKVIGRGGVGLDNIDVDFAKSKGIQVVNTPAASSRSVAELAMAHVLSCSRFVYQSNRAMPEDGDNNFKALKKSYAKGSEVDGKILGVLGAGRIGQETMKLAIGMGMKIVAHDPFVDTINLELNIADQKINVPIKTVSKEEMLKLADYISLHIPFTGEAALQKSDFDQMKNGVILVNCARGGTVDEAALLDALNNGAVAAAGLDVFLNEPKPRTDLLEHPRVSLTPHIGASTNEAQEKIGIELAEKLISILG